MINNLYQLHVDVSVNLSEQIVSAIRSERFRNEINPKYTWLFRLNHIEKERINRLKKDGPLGSMTTQSYSVCESYLQEKMIKLSFVGHGDRTTKKLILVHTDVCGLFDVPVREDYVYFITFINHGIGIYMGYKSKLFKKFKEFRCEVEL